MGDPASAPPDPAAAIDAARQACAADPGNVHLSMRLSHLLLSAGRHDQALREARRAGGLAPNAMHVVRFMSGIEAACRHYEAAAASAALAVAMAPGNAEARVHYAGVLLALQRPQAAVEHLIVAAEGPNPTSIAWRMLSSAMLELGRPDRAIEAVERAIALAPNETELRLHRAALLSSRGRLIEALQEIEVALEQVPDDARVFRARSGLFDALGRPAEALDDAERAVALNPNDAEFRAHLQVMGGQYGVPTDGAAPPDPARLAKISAAWLNPPPRPPPRARRKTGVGEALRVQRRVIFAVMLRDMRTRFGRSRLGYVWAIVEPILHLATLGSVFAWLNHAKPPVGNNLYLFYVTGLVPFLMFSHVAMQMMHILQSNVAMLQLPIVKQSDVIVARALLGLATEVCVGVVVFSGFFLLGFQGMPADPLTCMQAVLAMWLFAFGIGVINMVVAEFFRAWETIMGAVMQLLYFASGIYYSPIMMPAWVRDILVWNPTLQGVEWFRSGFFANYEPHWLDKSYLLVCAMLALLIGLSMHRALQRRLVVY